MHFSIWPAPCRRRRTRRSQPPAGPTPTAGTASGSPITTCRTPGRRFARPGRHVRVLVGAAGDRRGHRAGARRPAGLADVGAPPGVLANRAATIDHLSGRPHGARSRRRLADQRARRVRHRARAAGRACQPVRGGDPDRAVAARRGPHRVPRRLLRRSPTRRAIRSRSRRHCRSLVGTGSPRMSRITARHADEWNTWGTIEVASRRRATFAAACEAVGRDPATMHTSVQALRLARGRSGDRTASPIAGSPAAARRSSTRSAGTPSWASTSSSCRCSTSAAAPPPGRSSSSSFQAEIVRIGSDQLRHNSSRDGVGLTRSVTGGTWRGWLRRRRRGGSSAP